MLVYLLNTHVMKNLYFPVDNNHMNKNQILIIIQDYSISLEGLDRNFALNPKDHITLKHNGKNHARNMKIKFPKCRTNKCNQNLL